MDTFSIASGSLAETSAIRLFAAAHMSQATGALVFEQDRATKTIEFYRGRIARARSNQLSESLGRLLVAWGTITRESYLASLERMDTGREKHGQILVEMAALDPAAIPEALRKQTWTRLVDAASWTAGTYRFDPVNTVPSSDHFSLWKIFQEAMLRRFGRDALTEAARNARASAPKRKTSMMEPVLTGFSDVLKLYNDLDGRKTVAMLAGRAENQLAYFADLLVLEELQLLEFTSAPETDIVEMAFKRARKLAPTDLFGLEKGADKAAIEGALKRLQAKFPPETHGGSRFYEPLMRTLEQAATTLLSHRSQSQGGNVLSPQAERSFQLGRDYLGRKQYEFAVQKFEEALFHTPDSQEVKGYLAWTRFMQRPLDEALRKQAAEALTAAAQENQEDADVHAYLGAVLKLLGRLVEAEDAFSRALEVAPEHGMARRELDSIRLRRRHQVQKRRIPVESIRFKAAIIIQRWVGDHSVVMNFDKSEIRVGSGPHDDLVVSAEVLPQVLAAHAAVLYKNHHHYVRRNGAGGLVTVNGNEVAVREEIVVTAHDHVVLGDAEKGPTLEFRVFDKAFLSHMEKSMLKTDDFWIG